jgi:hypothetical protein
MLRSRHQRREIQVRLELVPRRERGKALRAIEEQGSGIGEDGERWFRLLSDVEQPLLGSADLRHEHLEPRITLRLAASPA